MKLPRVGERFRGKYQLEAPLGQGGFAVVFRALDVELQREVAIKILTPDADGYPPRLASRFMREAQIIASLRDPHTITLYEFGEDESGLLFMVFEYVAGRDLSSILRTQGALAPEAARHILEQLLESLREAHQAGVLHRDVKPPNVLVYEYRGDPYRAKLLDFGIAKHANPAAAGPQLTREGAAIGTPRYMSPEQVYGEALTAASDLYSVGLVAHEMLTGAAAVPGENSRDIMRAHVTGAPIQLPRDGAIPPELRAVVDRLTARELEDRFSSAEEALAALKGAPVEVTRRESGPVAGVRDEPAVRTPVESSRVTYPEVSAEGQPEVNAVDRVGPVLVLAAVAVFAALAFGVWRVARVPDGDVATPQLTPPAVDFVRADVGARGAASSGGGTESPLDVGGNTASLADAAPAGDFAQPDPDATGCGREATPGLHTLGEQGGDTEWAVHVPKGYRADEPHPVVMIFHTDGRTGPEFLAQTRFAELADEKGFLVVAPTQTATGMLGNSWVWRSPGEVARVATALAEASRDYCVDQSRVFAVGHMAGVYVTRRLACEPWVTGVAINSYRLTPIESLCPNPKPTIIFSPIDSPRLPVGGGMPGCMMPATMFSLERMEELFREQNRCEGAGKPFTGGDECREYACEAPLVACRVRGGVGWGGSSIVETNFGTCVDDPPKFDVTPRMWEFFAGLEPLAKR